MAKEYLPITYCFSFIAQHDGIARYYDILKMDALVLGSIYHYVLYFLSRFGSTLPTTHAVTSQSMVTTRYTMITLTSD